MNINVIVLETKLHSGENKIESRGYLFDSLKAFYNITTNVTNDADATIVFIASGGTEEAFLKLYPQLKSPIIILSDAHSNSFAAASEICSWLDQNNILHYKINVPLNPTDKYIGELKSQIDNIYKEAQLFKKLSGERIGLIGEPSSWLIASNINKDNIQENWGVQFIDIEVNEVLDFINKIKDSKVDYTQSSIFKKYQHLLEQGRTEEDLVNALIVYEALNNICIKYKLTALTIKCFDILKLTDLTACLALAILNDKEIVAGCEGDIPSLFTLLIVNRAYGKKGFMANPSSSDADNLTIDFSHCTIPISMTKSFTLPTHFESDKSIAIRGILPEGEYCIAKIGGINFDKFFRCKGEIITNPTVPFRCRTQIKFKFQNKEDYNKFNSLRLGNHIIIYKD